MSTETLPPCRGLTGRLFGHKFKARFDTKQDYPPNTVEALRDSLARVVVDPLHGAWQTIDKVCEGYRCMDISADTYVLDVCTRCGITVKRERSVTPAPEPVRSVTVAQPVQATPAPAPAPTSMPPAQQIVVVPATPANVAAALNRPAQAPSPVRAVPGRGPKV